jgi:hypothetical protein
VTASHELLTIGEAAAMLGCDAWQLRRLYTRGLLPEPQRVGPFRVIPSNDLGSIERALRKAGYLAGGAPA